MVGRTARIVSLLLTAALASACGGEDASTADTPASPASSQSVPSSPSGTVDNTGGGPIPQQFDGETYTGRRRPLEVRVALADNGCFLGALDARPGTTYLLVWPTGSESAGDRVVLPDDTEVADGDVLAGTGLLFPAAELAGMGESSFWDGIVGFCDQGAERVLVLDSAERL